MENYYNYQKILDTLQENINKLNSWYNYIEYDGINYGIPFKVKNKIHRENDCNGKMILIHSDGSSCSTCENSMWHCRRECYTITNTYKCDICGYIYKTTDEE